MDAETKPKLIFLVTEDWFFWLHRRPMARAAQEAGFEAALATRVGEHGPRIRELGIRLHPLPWRRGAFGPWANLAALVRIYRLYRRERPAIVQQIGFKPAILGTIAAIMAGVPTVVNVITGTGFIGGWRSLRARAFAAIIRFATRMLLLRGNRWVIVENEDDRRAVAALRPSASPRVLVIAGAGVDLQRFKPLPEPASPPVVAAYVGRMVGIKGVATLVEAQQDLQRRGIDLRLLLVGAPDPENPTAIAEATLRQWHALPGVQWLGRLEEVSSAWAQAHIAVLASLGGEGLPVSLVEAAAIGRPIVATDIPGSRDIARQDHNGLLVPPGDPAALAEALASLAADPERRRRFGAAGRALVEARFSDRVVITWMKEFYARLRSGS